MTDNRGTALAFDPFNERLARTIRNELSSLFVYQALRHSGQQAPLAELARRLAALPRCAPPHRQYIAGMLERYRPILAEVAQGGCRTPLRLAVRLWNDGLFFECHEVLEQLFHLAQGSARQGLQGWIQAAGSYLLRQAGRTQGAQRLAAKAMTRLGFLTIVEPGLTGVAPLLRDLAAGGLDPPQLTLGKAPQPSPPPATPLSAAAERVQQALQAAGFTCRVRELSGSTRTAAEAAATVGCQVGQIVKSLVLAGRRSHQLLLVVASGANRLDLAAIGRRLGEPVAMAKAERVRASTGFAIGGVPPLGHRQRLQALVDADLLAYDELWAAAGTPHAMFRLTPAELLAMTAGQVVALKEQTEAPPASG